MHAFALAAVAAATGKSSILPIESIVARIADNRERHGSIAIPSLPVLLPSLLLFPQWLGCLSLKKNPGKRKKAHSNSSLRLYPLPESLACSLSLGRSANTILAFI